MPNPSGPASASPESLTMTRRYCGTAMPRLLPSSARALHQRGDLSAKITLGAIDAFAQHVAHKGRDLDRPADLALRLLERLSDSLVGGVDVGLIEQAGLLVEGLEAGLDDL